MSESNLSKRFEFAQLKEDIKDVKFEGEAVGFFKDAMLRFAKNKSSVISFVVIIFIVIMALVGPLISPYTWNQQETQRALLPPRIPVLEKLGIFDGQKTMNIQKRNIDVEYKDAIVKVNKEYKEKGIEMVNVDLNMYKLRGCDDVYYWFGTDSLGRSSWSRVWKGARISLLIAVITVSVNVTIGLIYGSISGYYGGAVDMIMQRFIEILTGIPTFVLTILFIMVYGTGLMPIALSMVLTGWVGTSHGIRAQFYRYKGREYVLASRTMGASDKRLIFRHILPNAIGPIITSVSVAIPGAIMGEAGLAYLGLGLEAPKPSVGVLLSEGQQVLLLNPHLTLFPAILISVLVIAFNLMGNGLRDAFNPTLRGVE